MFCIYLFDRQITEKGVSNHLIALRLFGDYFEDNFCEIDLENIDSFLLRKIQNQQNRGVFSLH